MNDKSLSGFPTEDKDMFTMVGVWEHVNRNGLGQSEWRGLPCFVTLHQAEHVVHHLPVFWLTGYVNEGGEERNPPGRSR